MCCRRVLSLRTRSRRRVKTLSHTCAASATYGALHTSRALLTDCFSALLLADRAVACVAAPRALQVNSSFGFSGTAYARSCVPQNESLLALALREEGVEVPLGGDATSPVAAGGISSRAIVPPAFFREDFDLRDPDTFHDALCSSTSLILHHKARTLSCPRRVCRVPPPADVCAACRGRSCRCTSTPWRTRLQGTCGHEPTTSCLP
jgi:hypothetical protein